MDMKRSLAAAAMAALSTFSLAGSVFLTGHDPDFHAQLGGNAVGAQHINQRAISYIMDAAFNPYAAGGATKFLFVESSITPPGGHTDGEAGIIASGYTAGVNYERHSAADLNAELNLLGFKYGGIVVASDFGGILTQAELDILNARKGDIVGFINSGGGLYAMAEGNGGAHLTPNGGHFQFLPFVTVAVTLDQSETGFTTTAFGQSLGLTDGDINGNASHNIFTSYGTLNVVDRDAAGDVMSVAGRGLVPEPASLLALGSALLLLRRKQK